MLMGGRTAEELIFGDPTTGAQNDIERATQIARAMVTQFGMSDAHRPAAARAIAAASPSSARRWATRSNYSDEVAAAIDTEVRRLVDEAHDEAREILTLHRATLDQLADALVAHETLADSDLAPIWDELDLRGRIHRLGR